MFKCRTQERVVKGTGEDEMKLKNSLRGCCFILTAALVVMYERQYPLWLIVIWGGIIGLCASIGWED